MCKIYNEYVIFCIKIKKKMVFFKFYIWKIILEED